MSTFACSCSRERVSDMLRSLGLDEALRRAEAYHLAGADGNFITDVVAHQEGARAARGYQQRRRVGGAQVDGVALENGGVEIVAGHAGGGDV